MIVEVWQSPEWIGNVKIKSYRVTAPEDEIAPENNWRRSFKYELGNIKEEDIYKTQEKMGIVVPVCGEEISTIKNVISYIPSNCPTIVVSNSPGYRYEIEKSKIEKYFGSFRENIKMVHQKDPKLGEAFRESGYEEILNKGLVKDGKGEGLIIGNLLALKEGVDYVGFVDADNYFPASIREYIRDYAAGFNLAETSNSMVRLKWTSKSDIKGKNFVFTESGRCSKVTNDFMNRLLSEITGDDIECIETGNAGEHAISKPLIENMSFASGYNIEPYELIYAFEKFGGVGGVTGKKAEEVEIIQMKTINPHLHKKGSKEHIDKMMLGSIGTIYHSRLCGKYLKKEIEEFIKEKKLSVDEPPEPTVYPPLSEMDQKKFGELVESAIEKVGK